MRALRSFDVFCRVVDNFGDAAVCWRLARGLAAETGAQTRLWIDDLDALQALAPQLAAGRPQQSFDGVEICHWTAHADFGLPADVVVDAFGGGIPDAYAEAMAGQDSAPVRPLWIVLEYLSAEPWVAKHHGLPSPHPRLRDPRKREAFWRDAGFAPPAPGATLISHFGYENPAAAELLDAWASGEEAVVAAVPRSRLRGDVAVYLGIDAGTENATEVSDQVIRRGSLEVRFLPFLAQDRYDELLWAADWNFVRGEDSFVRAQWAERPFVWHAYPQKEGAHVTKLEAFLEIYCRGLAPELAAPLAALWRGWNAAAPLPAGATARAWSALAPQGAALEQRARAWAAEAAKSGDLVRNLTKFCAERLE